MGKHTDQLTHSHSLSLSHKHTHTHDDNLTKPPSTLLERSLLIALCCVSVWLHSATTLVGLLVFFLCYVRHHVVRSTLINSTYTPSTQLLIFFNIAYKQPVTLPLATCFDLLMFRLIWYKKVKTSKSV